MIGVVIFLFLLVKDFYPGSRDVANLIIHENDVTRRGFTGVFQI